MNFPSKWATRSAGFKDKLRESLAPQKDLRSKIENAARVLDRQSKKLEVAIRALKEKDRRYFTKVVEAIKDHDRTRAIIYANELVEIRKSLRILNSARYAIESVMLRLSTVQDLGDAVAEILPIMQVLKSVKTNLSVILPSAEDGLNQVSNLLQDIMWDAQTAGIEIMDTAVANEEAQKILSEAERRAREEMEKELPTIPTEVKEGTRETETEFKL